VSLQCRWKKVKGYLPSFRSTDSRIIFCISCQSEWRPRRLERPCRFTSPIPKIRDTRHQQSSTPIGSARRASLLTMHSTNQPGVSVGAQDLSAGKVIRQGLCFFSCHHLVLGEPSIKLSPLPVFSRSEVRYEMCMQKIHTIPVLNS